jgi:hypothetical protein
VHGENEGGDMPMLCSVRHYQRPDLLASALSTSVQLARPAFVTLGAGVLIKPSEIAEGGRLHGLFERSIFALKAIDQLGERADALSLCFGQSLDLHEIVLVSPGRTGRSARKPIR